MDQDKNAKSDLSALAIAAEARHHSGPGKPLILGLAAGGALLAVVLLWVMLRSRPILVDVALARAVVGDESATVLNASGYVTPRRRATVAAKITGRVKEMLVEEGMAVRQGQVLALLDDADARASFIAAQADREVTLASIPGLQANLKEAALNLQRTRELRKDGYTDQSALDRAQAGHDSLRAQLEVARKQVDLAASRMAVAQREIENCTVRAPFAGIAVSKDAQPGEIVSPVSAGGGFTRTGISTIVDMASLEIEVDVNESNIAKVAPGQKVAAILNAYPDWSIPCSVRTIIPIADRQKATVKVRIAFDELDTRILPDMGVKVSFLAAQETEGSSLAKALIPREAVRSINGQAVVFVLREGKLERRAVGLGENLGNDVQVTAGVDPGEQVVINGPPEMADGRKALSEKK
jgi:RND family efflux transporter MFP subunit